MFTRKQGGCGGYMAGMLNMKGGGTMEVRDGLRGGLFNLYINDITSLPKNTFIGVFRNVP